MRSFTDDSRPRARHNDQPRCRQSRGFPVVSPLWCRLSALPDACLYRVFRPAGDCLRRLRAAPGHPGVHRSRPHQPVALCRVVARRSRPRTQGVPRGGLDAAAPGHPPRRRARNADTVGQGRHREPHPLVQGQGRVGGAVGRARARVHHGRLRVHRQPGPVGGGARRVRRAALGCADPARSRGRQDRVDRRLRRHAGRDRGQLRRRQPPVQ